LLNDDNKICQRRYF